MSSLPTHVAAAQHGLLTTQQLRTAGFTSNQASRLVARGQLERLAPRVFRIAGARSTTAQRLLAGVLDVGREAAVSHGSALAWWGLPGFKHEPLHVTRPRGNGRRRHSLADHVHMVTDLPANHVRLLEDVLVVSPARALFDVAGEAGAHPRRVERAVDNAWAKGLVSGATLRSMLDSLGGRGRPGIGVMREILASRGPTYVPPASGLENRVIEVLRRAGERPLRRQVNCGDDGGWIGRVDFADDAVPFVLEVQSERFHSSLLDQRADKERLGRLRTAGFVVAAVTDTDVWQQPAGVVATVRTGRATARQRLLEAA